MRAYFQKDGGPTTAIFGLSDRNCERIRGGDALVVHGSEWGMDGLLVLFSLEQFAPTNEWIKARGRLLVIVVCPDDVLSPGSDSRAAIDFGDLRIVTMRAADEQAMYRAMVKEGLVRHDTTVRADGFPPGAFQVIDN